MNVGLFGLLVRVSAACVVRVVSEVSCSITKKLCTSLKEGKAGSYQRNLDKIRFRAIRKRSALILRAERENINHLKHEIAELLDSCQLRVEIRNSAKAFIENRRKGMHFNSLFTLWETISNSDNNSVEQQIETFLRLKSI